MVATFEIRVQPRAGRDEVKALEDGTVRVRVKAAPERGKANDAVIRLLAKRLGVGRADVSIVRGRTSRVKTIRVAGIGARDAADRLMRGA